MLESKPQPEYSTEKWIGSLLGLSEQFLLITHVCNQTCLLIVYSYLNINKHNQ